MVHSRAETEGAGFEFVHKSFGEYLAARGLIGGAKRLLTLTDSDDFDATPINLAERWCRFVGDANLTPQVRKFLEDEARLQGEAVWSDLIPLLTNIFDETLRKGFPVHRQIDPNKVSYRILEARQRSAETCILATLTLLWKAQNRNLNRSGQQAEFINFKTFNSEDGTEENTLNALEMIERVFPSARQAQGMRATLTSLSLRNAILNNSSLHQADTHSMNIRGAHLSGADLRGADLSGAHLRGADLGEAELQSTNLSDYCMDATLLRLVDCTVAQNLTETQISRSFGVKVGFGKTGLHQGMVYPGHWHVAKVADEDSGEKFDAYQQAWRSLRSNS